MVKRTIMKMNFRLFAVALTMLFAAAACQKEVAGPAPQSDRMVEVTLSASIDATKATVNAAGKVLWEEGDKIAVKVAGAPYEFTLKSGAGTTSAVFQGSLPLGTARISASAPFDAYSSLLNQTIASGRTIDPKAVLMEAPEVNLGTTLSFANTSSIIRLAAPSGTKKVTFGDYTLTIDALAADTDLDLVVPAGSYDAFVTVTDSSDDLYVKCSTNALEAVAGQITPVRNIKGTRAMLITDAASLASWAGQTALCGWIANDIDASSISLPAGATIPAGSGLYGNGHSIKNWTSTGAALVAANNGTVRDIIIDSSCSLTPPSPVNGDFGFIVCTNTGTVSGCTNNADINLSDLTFDSSANDHFGPIVGHAKNASAIVSGCVNNGNLTYTFTPTANTVYMGGVCGKMETAGAKIVDCVNNGSISLTANAATTNNHYIGGVTGSTNNESATIRCKNYGDVTFHAPSGGAAMMLGGVTSYTAGNITDCYNEGDISYISDAMIRGTMVGGIAGYTPATISGCTNKGDVSVSGKYFGQRNTVGNIGGDYSTSAVTVLIGGVLGVGSPASTCKFVMTDCINEGNVSYTLTDPTATGVGIASDARHCVGGLVGDASGPITGSASGKSYNSGNVSVSFTNTAGTFVGSNAGYTIYCGGVAGSNYYSKNQTEMNITGLENRGNVSVTSQNTQTTNHAVGGIVGWPGKESSCTSITSGCTNSGSVSVEGNITVRVGGIQGGSGRIESCVNTGDIYSDATTKAATGGIAGFHSGGYQLTACTVKACTVKSDNCVNGLAAIIGNIGNAAHTTGTGCKVDCTIEGKAGASDAAFIIGKFNGTTQAITFGSEESPVKVKGTIKIGSTTTVLDATNLADYLHGTTNYTPAKHAFYAEYGE